MNKFGAPFGPHQPSHNSYALGVRGIRIAASASYLKAQIVLDKTPSIEVLEDNVRGTMRSTRNS